MLTREGKLKFCYALKDGVPTLLSWPAVQKAMGVSGVIRIHAEDYALFPAGNRYTHFNLEYSGHIPGHLYILSKILKPGYLRKNNDERPPLLDFSDCYIARCLSARERVPYNALTPSDFSTSLKNMKTVPDLQREILWRYTQSLPDVKPETILKKGVSITELEIIGKTPPCAF